MPLTELGWQQAAAVAATIRAIGTPDRVIASPLRRAQDTARAFDLPVETDERWIEVDYGEYDGLPMASVPASLWSSWRRDLSFVPPGGESLAAVGARVRAALVDLSGFVVVVSHVSPIKAAVAWALGVDEQVAWRMFLAPGSYSCVALDDGGPSLHAFNVTPAL